MTLASGLDYCRALGRNMPALRRGGSTDSEAGSASPGQQYRHGTDVVFVAVASFVLGFHDGDDPEPSPDREEGVAAAREEIAELYRHLPVLEKREQRFRQDNALRDCDFLLNPTSTPSAMARVTAAAQDGVLAGEEREWASTLSDGQARRIEDATCSLLERLAPVAETADGGGDARWDGATEQWVGTIGRAERLAALVRSRLVRRMCAAWQARAIGEADFDDVLANAEAEVLAGEERILARCESHAALDAHLNTGDSASVGFLAAAARAHEAAATAMLAEAGDEGMREMLGLYEDDGTDWDDGTNGDRWPHSGLAAELADRHASLNAVSARAMADEWDAARQDLEYLREHAGEPSARAHELAQLYLACRDGGEDA